MANSSNGPTVIVRLVKSPWGRLPDHRACIVGLGLRRIGSSRRLEDTPSVRGMINKVRYLLEVEEVPAEDSLAEAEGPPGDASESETLAAHAAESDRGETPSAQETATAGLSSDTESADQDSAANTTSAAPGENE